MENQTAPNSISRRSIFGRTAAAATAFQIIKPELVRGQGKEKLRAGLVGFGGRGRQAIVDHLMGTENTEVVAAADIFEDKLEGNLRWLREEPRNAAIRDRVKIDPDKRFVGFDAFQKLLKTDIDVVFLATPPGYRPEHFEAAINAKKHVFCEKPFGTDPAGVRRFMAAAKKSEELKLTVVSGAQRRFDRRYMETYDRIKSGQIGDLTAGYAYWVGNPVIQQKARESKWADMTWQHRAWYSFVWICGDQVVEQHLHNIDVMNWFIGAHPTKVVATGGRCWRPGDEIYGNIYDHCSTDIEYPGGIRVSSYCRQFPAGSHIHRKVGEMLVGTKGRSNCLDLAGPGPEPKPYVAEHTALAKSIRGEGPYINHAMAVAESTLTCIMARESAYSGQEITWEQAMNSKLDLQPKKFGYEEKMEVPPLPQPGVYKFA